MNEPICSRTEPTLFEVMEMFGTEAAGPRVVRAAAARHRLKREAPF